MEKIVIFTLLYCNRVSASDDYKPDGIYCDYIQTLRYILCSTLEGFSRLGTHAHWHACSMLNMIPLVTVST